MNGERGRGQRTCDERGRDGSACDERGRDERGRDGRGSDGSARDERGRDERGRDERGRDERGSDGSARDERERDERERDERGRDGPGSNERGRDERGRDEPPGVRDVYDRIADHFSETREHPWPAVERFVADAPRAALALDVGCGNGRHAELLAERAERVVGVDASPAVLAVARERARERGYADGVEWVAGDARRLPVPDSRVDIALYIATVHHLRDRAARVASLDELARVLAPGGRALVSAWATVHERFDADAGEPGFDTTVDWTLPDGETVPRFYHIYAPGEFRDDVVASELDVERVFVEAGNCYAVVRG